VLLCVTFDFLVLRSVISQRQQYPSSRVVAQTRPNTELRQVLFDEPLFLGFFFDALRSVSRTERANHSEEMDAAHRQRGILQLGRAVVRAGAVRLFARRLSAGASYGVDEVATAAPHHHRGRDCGQSLGARLLQIYRLRRGKSQCLVIIAHRNSDPAAAYRPADRCFVCGVREDYLPGRDIYRGTRAPAPRFTDYCLFVFFFPKLLAGPILKYHELQQQIAQPVAVGWDDFSAGFPRLSRGMANKLLVADPVGALADQAFTATPGSITFGASPSASLARELE
jgi:hypothetical protein